jgi:hypothetical protein
MVGDSLRAGVGAIATALGFSSRRVAPLLSPSDLGGASAFVVLSAPEPTGPELLNALTMDFGERIEGSLAAWRAANPDANTARVNGRHDVDDDACEHLRGVRALNIAGCTAVTDAGFAHLGAVEVLVMSGLTRVTDAGLRHLTRVRKLVLKNCTGVSDAAFAPLRATLYSLDVDGCRQLTAAALAGLEQLHTVSAALCQRALKDRADAISHKAGAAPRARPPR